MGKFDFSKQVGFPPDGGCIHAASTPGNKIIVVVVVVVAVVVVVVVVVVREVQCFCPRARLGIGV